LFAERVAGGGASVASEDVRLDSAAFRQLGPVVAPEALGRFLDGIHVKRDQGGVRVGFSGFQPCAQAGKGLSSPQVCAIGDVGSLCVRLVRWS